MDSKNNHSAKYMIKNYVANWRESLCRRTPSILYKFILELYSKESFGTAKQYYDTGISSFLQHVVACATAGGLLATTDGDNRKLLQNLALFNEASLKAGIFSIKNNLALSAISSPDHRGLYG